MGTGSLVHEANVLGVLLSHKLGIFIDDDDFAKRQWSAAHRVDIAEDDDSFTFINSGRISAKDIKESPLIYLISRTWFFLNRQSSNMYEYWYRKNTSFSVKVLLHVVPKSILKVFYRLAAHNVVFRDCRLDKAMASADTILVYSGHYSRDLRYLISAARKARKPLYLLPTGWDNLTSKLPLSESVEYLSPDTGSLKFLRSKFEESYKARLFPLPNHDPYKSQTPNSSFSRNDPLRILFAGPVKEYPNELILSELAQHDHQVDFKLHPAKNFTVLGEYPAFCQIREIKKQLIRFNSDGKAVGTFDSMSDLLNSYDVVVSPLGSLCLEATILNKLVIGLGFWGLGANYYGESGLRSKHISDLFKFCPLYLAYDMNQFREYLRSLMLLIRKQQEERSVTEYVDSRAFVDALQELR